MKYVLSRTNGDIVVEKDYESFMKCVEENRADLSEADLRWADLSEADLRWADLRWADLRWADLSEADLSRADLRWADLRGANLSGAKNTDKMKLWDTNLCETKTDKKYYQIQCVGSRNANTTYCVDDDMIFCGCWTGKLKEFEKRVEETHKNNKQYLKEYMSVIKFFKSMRKK